jgi:hypothetical protein
MRILPPSKNAAAEPIAQLLLRLQLNQMPLLLLQGLHGVPHAPTLLILHTIPSSNVEPFCN